MCLIWVNIEKNRIFVLILCQRTRPRPRWSLAARTTWCRVNTAPRRTVCWPGAATMARSATGMTGQAQSMLKTSNRILQLNQNWRQACGRNSSLRSAQWASVQDNVDLKQDRVRVLHGLIRRQGLFGSPVNILTSWTLRFSGGTRGISLSQWTDWCWIPTSRMRTMWVGPRGRASSNMSGQFPRNSWLALSRVRLGIQIYFFRQLSTQQNFKYPYLHPSVA